MTTEDPAVPAYAEQAAMLAHALRGDVFRYAQARRAGVIPRWKPTTFTTVFNRAVFNRALAQVTAQRRRELRAMLQADDARRTDRTPTTRGKETPR